MPIKPELRSRLYNTQAWREQRVRVLERAGFTCECTGHCGVLHVRDAVCFPRGRCRSTERLQVAHKNHNSGELVSDNELVALCSACHLRYDEKQHIAERRRRRRRQLELLGQGSLV